MNSSKKEMQLVATDSFKVPKVPPAKKKKKVLDEETYLNKLSRIIERDFFPDLDNLKDKLEYIEAKESDDFVKLREIYEKYSTTRSKKLPIPSPDQSPATFETPVLNPRENEDEICSVVDQEMDTDETGSEIDKELPCLDKFMNTHTSEDNENFEIQMEKTRKNIMAKNPWLYEAEGKHNEKHLPNLELTSVEEQTTNRLLAITGTTNKEKDIRPTQVENWSYKTFNSVMYPPEGVELSNNQTMKKSKLKKKEVVYNNTRFESNPFDETVSQATMMEASAIQASKKEGKVGIDGKELSKDIPTVNGYSYVPNPSPKPGVDSTPLMTWGEVEGTPFQLDGSKTPLIRGNGSSGPSYRIPKVPDKDQLVMKLVEKANQTNKEKKSRALSVARSYLSTPTPKFGRPSSIDRMSTMSPAARKLMRKEFPSGDRSLRASYTPRTDRSSSSIFSTPGAKTPNLFSPLTKPSRLKSVNCSPAIAKGLTDNLLELPRKNLNDKTPSGLTDNLLQLPKTKTSKTPVRTWCKASDFF